MTLGKRQVLGLVLLVSLGANVLLGGLLIGGWACEGPRHSGGGFDRQAAREALPPESRKLADDIWSEHEAKIRCAFKAVREARQDIQRVLAADEFDRAALETAQAALTTRWDGVRTAMAASLSELALALSPDERKRYFTAGAKHGEWRGPRSGEAEVPAPSQ
ncbi:MAG: periplasmic heavy metal sensor [Alphaproteobacteria bacterium]|nr:periplasmic heavy metal sensor [Alphaproteobacteria bacterium]